MIYGTNTARKSLKVYSQDQDNLGETYIWYKSFVWVWSHHIMLILAQKQVEVREDRLKKISDNISAKKAQQEPGVTCLHSYIWYDVVFQSIQFALLKWLRQPEWNVVEQPHHSITHSSHLQTSQNQEVHIIFILYCSYLLTLVTPMMKKARDMAKERYI